MSGSQAVRRLYDYIGTTGSVPDFLLVDYQKHAERRHRRLEAIERFRNNRVPVTLSDEEITDLLNDARKERFA